MQMSVGDKPIWESVILWPSHLPLVKDMLRNGFSIKKRTTSGTIPFSEICNHKTAHRLHLSYDEWLGELGLFSLITLYNHLKEGCSQVGWPLLPGN